MSVLITGEELTELQRHTWRMSEAFGLDQRIANYKGTRPIGFHSWDLECLLCLDDALNDPREYPDKNQPEYKALEGLVNRLRAEYETNFS